MRKPVSLNDSTEYRPALLWLMNEIGSGRTADVIDEFGRRFAHLILPQHREKNNSGNIIWDWWVRWSRQDLVDAGLMGSGGRGIWIITQAGRDWLEAHPDGDVIRHKTTDTSQPARQSARRPQDRPAQVSGALRAVLDQQTAQIRSFLQGRAARPSDEVMCDWVQFCYTFQLYREAVEVFDLIDPAAVHEWPYSKAKRLAEVSRIKLGR